MAHLSKKDLSDLIQKAVNGYMLGQKVEANIPFLDAYKKAHEHQMKEQYNPFIAYGIYDEAKRQADAAEEGKALVFINTISEELRKQFIVEDRVFTAVDEINQRLSQLNSIWKWFNPLNWFKPSAKTAIADLESLKKILLNQTEGTIREAIELWEHDKALDSATANLVAHLKREYGEEPLESRSELSREVKQKLYQPFLDYVHSRTSWLQQLITFIFRNHELSEQKLAFAQTVAEDVQDCRGSYGQLIDQLKTDQEAHAKMSEHHEKKHYNLRENRGYIELPPPSTSSEMGHEPDAYHYYGRFLARTLDIKEGEDSNRSELADAFHKAIEMRM
ncbi:hypothetical protein [Legionella sp.]|uniref:hypothetical protein n=1 Tax=Legionella sp. TaxID=459 RepID=UPI00322046DB